MCGRPRRAGRRRRDPAASNASSVVKRIAFRRTGCAVIPTLINAQTDNAAAPMTQLLVHQSFIFSVYSWRLEGLQLRFLSHRHPEMVGQHIHLPSRPNCRKESYLIAL